MLFFAIGMVGLGLLILNNTNEYKRTIHFRAPRKPYIPYKQITSHAHSNPEFVCNEIETGAYLGIPKEYWISGNGSRTIMYGRNKNKFTRQPKTYDSLNHGNIDYDKHTKKVWGEAGIPL